MSDEVAKILDQALDSVLQGESVPAEWVDRYPQYREEIMGLLEMAVQIHSLSLPEPSREFKTHSRLRILRYITLKQSALQAAARKPVYRKPARRAVPMFRRTALSFAMVVTLLVALFSTGTVYASNNTIPGDTLYPVKIALEDARLAIANNEQDAQLYIQFSERRVQEIELLMEKGRIDKIPVAVERYEKMVDGVIKVLPQVSFQALTAAEQSAMRKTVARNTEVLTSLLARPKFPDPAKPAIQHAIESSSKEEEELDEVLPLAPKGKPSDVESQEQPTAKPTKTPRATSTPKPLQVPESTKVPGGNQNSPPGGSSLEPTAEKPTRQP